MTAWARAGLTVITIVLLQLTLFDGLRVAGIAPEVALGLAVAAGITGGSTNGAVLAFATGLALDLFLATPFGLSALSFCLVAYLAGMFANSVSDTNWVAAAPLVAVGTAVGLCLYVLFGEILGQPNFYSPDLWRIVLVAATIGLVIGGPLTKLMRWVWGAPNRLATSHRPLGLVN
jgi:rod shape-determining protein MreD